MTITNRLAILLTVSAVTLFAVNGIATECKDTYYYVFYNHGQHYKTDRVRAFELTIRYAYIYDKPFLPSSWVYDITDYDNSWGVASVMTAAAKSDKDIIKYKDFKKLVIIRQPKNKSDDKIRVNMRAIYMKKEGGIGIGFPVLNIDNEDFTLKKINKCLTPQRH
ncbi:hypothetical protein [Candidatus Magnetominusculus dajiuhuensis]|uniref:hypothetical protein n=1 Tax=Candidatus Magnetominusculus dajiuhuensis TaxID=3137712 RepID=UPI003B43C728